MSIFDPSSSQTGANIKALRGKVVTPSGILNDGLLVAEDETISWVGAAGDAISAGVESALHEALRVPDTDFILPGLVDGHCHGGGGFSFPDAISVGDAERAANEHLRHGTTTLVASLVTAQKETLLRQIDLLLPLCRSGILAGIHLEGPFLSIARCGAQDPQHIQTPDLDVIFELIEKAAGYLAMMTIAPELNEILGPNGTISALARSGVLPAFGHTDADYPTTETAIAQAAAALATSNARARLPIATHLFNGMRPLHHRDPGPVAACLAGAAQGKLIVELIADGVHLAPDTVRAVFQMIGPDAIMLVTDAMAAAGMSDGDYDLGSARVRVTGGIARLRDGDTIAGGTSHLLDIVRTTVRSGVPVVDVVRAASTTPARALGIARNVGGLVTGLRADVVVTDSGFHARAVARAGRWEYLRG